MHGVGTLDALLRGDGVDVACVDARRGEVFAAGAGVDLGAYRARGAGPGCRGGCSPATAPSATASSCTGSRIAAADSPLHVPWARHHAALIEGRWAAPDPLYVRAPDADRVLPVSAAT